MTRRKQWLSAALMLVVFIATFLLVFCLGDPRGDPDRALLCCVTAVFSLSSAMLVRELIDPKRFMGDDTGLGAFSVSVGLSVLAMAVAGLAVAFAGLRHPVVAGCISAAALVLIVLHRLLAGLLAKLCWGVPIANHPSECAIWKARVANLISEEKNETTLRHLSELLVLCAKQPESPAGALKDKALCAVNLEIDERLSELRASIEEGHSLSEINERIEALEKSLGERLKCFP